MWASQTLKIGSCILKGSIGFWPAMQQMSSVVDVPLHEELVMLVDLICSLQGNLRGKEQLSLVRDIMQRVRGFEEITPETQTLPESNIIWPA